MQRPRTRASKPVVAVLINSWGQTGQKPRVRPPPIRGTLSVWLAGGGELPHNLSTTTLPERTLVCSVHAARPVPLPKAGKISLHTCLHTRAAGNLTVRIQGAATGRLCALGLAAGEAAREGRVCRRARISSAVCARVCGARARGNRICLARAGWAGFNGGAGAGYAIGGGTSPNTVLHSNSNEVKQAKREIAVRPGSRHIGNGRGAPARQLLKRKEGS